MMSPWEWQYAVMLSITNMNTSELQWFDTAALRRPGCNCEIIGRAASGKTTLVIDLLEKSCAKVENVQAYVHPRHQHDVYKSLLDSENVTDHVYAWVDTGIVIDDGFSVKGDLTAEEKVYFQWYLSDSHIKTFTTMSWHYHRDARSPDIDFKFILSDIPFGFKRDDWWIDMIFKEYPVFQRNIEICTKNYGCLVIDMKTGHTYFYRAETHHPFSRFGVLHMRAISAARCIQRRWLQCYYDPKELICQRRIAREAKDLVTIG